MMSNMAEQAGAALSGEDQRVLEILDDANRLYERYLEVTAFGSVVASWTQDDDLSAPPPDLPLTLVLNG